MVEKPVVGSNAKGVGDDAVSEATGRDRDEWFALLDQAGAAEWKHQAIATWLVRERHVDPWWSQGVTVAYEQARGIRQPGPRQDGTFEADVSRTVPLEKAEALRALAEVVSRELETEPLGLNLDAKHPTARFPLDGGEFVLATSTPAAKARPRSDSRGDGCPTARVSPTSRHACAAGCRGRMTRAARWPWASVEP